MSEYKSAFQLTLFIILNFSNLYRSDLVIFFCFNLAENVFTRNGESVQICCVVLFLTPLHSHFRVS